MDAEGRAQQHFQPHYQVITSPDQVQIYEELSHRPTSTTDSRLRRTVPPPGAFTIWPPI
jgi:hypothetical protein